MNAADVVAYSYEGALYCPDHVELPERVKLRDETRCHACGDPIAPGETAWTYSGRAYCCPGCAEDPELSPVFADNEGWRDHACDVCLREAIANGERPETLGEHHGLENPVPHYVYGSGMHGCLYDYGPNVAATLDDAVDALVSLFGDDESEAATEERVAEFEDDLRRYKYAELWKGAGAHYAEIDMCRCWHPEDHDPEGWEELS